VWCGYLKLGNYFHLTVFFFIDSVFFISCNDVALGLWMLLFGSLLTFFDDTYWPFVIDVYNKSVWYSTNCGRYSWGVSVWFGAGELIFRLCKVSRH
jgi:hypothetical protein